MKLATILTSLLLALPVFAQETKDPVVWEHEQQPAPATDREHDSSDPMITDLSKYDRDQLLSYAAGLDLPDSPIKTLHPKYLALKEDIAALRKQGFGDQHPNLAPKIKELEAVGTQLDLALDKLKATIQPKLDPVNARLERAQAASRTETPPPPAPSAPPDALAALETDKRFVEKAIASLSKLPIEQQWLYASGLDIRDGTLPVYPRYLELIKDLERLKAQGLGPDHPTVRERTLEVEKIRAELDALTAALKDHLRVKLEIANARLERERAASRTEAQPPSSTSGLRAEQARLTAQIKALSTLSGEALLIFAGNLGLASNPVPELHRRIADTTLELADLRAEGLATEHPKLMSKTQHLKALDQQLHQTIDGIKEALRANLTVVEAQLNAVGKSR